MSTGLIEFTFEHLPFRVLSGSNGEPLFVAADVLAALDLDRKALERLDDDEKGVSSVHTPGGAQVMTVVDEPGLYNLVIGSRKPEAKKFKRWVTHEVLPTLRKTGSYSVRPPVQDERVSAILLLGNAIAKVPGVKPNMVWAATLECVRANTGIEVEHLRRTLPGSDEPAGRLNPTQLGKLLEVSAKTVNARLAMAGLQVKGAREWELTPEGQKLAEAVPFSRHGHSGYQLLWNPAVLDLINSAAEARRA